MRRIVVVLMLLCVVPAWAGDGAPADSRPLECAAVVVINDSLAPRHGRGRAGIALAVGQQQTHQRVFARIKVRCRAKDDEVTAVGAQQRQRALLAFGQDRRQLAPASLGFFKHRAWHRSHARLAVRCDATPAPARPARDAEPLLQNLEDLCRVGQYRGLDVGNAGQARTRLGESL
jgi:hypothetical protein